MKILVTGANGLLGQELVKQLLHNTTHDVLATGKGEKRFPLAGSRLHYHALDLADGTLTNAWLLQERPDVIIHAAAMTQVDACEMHQVDCWNANVTATRFVLEAAKAFRPYFVFVSTDFVFSGDDGPYAETDATGPVNYYGSTKVAAEKAVLESGLDAGIVRTCLVYGSQEEHRETIVNRVSRQLREGKPMRMVNDQWRTPTYIGDLAKGILLMIEKKATGIFHIAGANALTPYTIAIATARHFGLDEKLISDPSGDEWKETAKRPLKTGLVIDKAREVLGYEPLSFDEALTMIRG